MSVARTARRRRKQATMGYRHIAPLKRPRYKKTDANKATRRLKQQVEKQKLMQQRKAFAKK